jgi:hypothetical protein
LVHVEVGVKLPEGFYDYVAGYFNDQIAQDVLMTLEEQLDWFNREFPEATWESDGMSITPKFKSPENEIMFLLRWS